MASIKGVVLRQKDGEITALTNEGEFKTFPHRRSLQIGEEVVKKEYGEYVAYVFMAFLLFLLTVGVFHFIIGH